MGEDLEFEFVGVGHAASDDRVFDRSFTVKDLVNLFFAGNAVAVVAVLVEGFVKLGDVGGFGEAEAEVVVLAVHEFGVKSADLLVDVGVHEAEVENDEFGEEAIFVVGDLAMLAVAFDAIVFVDDDVVGIDHADRWVVF